MPSDTPVANPAAGQPAAQTGPIDHSHHICACGNQRLTAYMNVKGGNMLECLKCGSFFSDMVAFVRSNPDWVIPRLPLNDARVEADFVARWRRNLSGFGASVAVATCDPAAHSAPIVKLPAMDAPALVPAIIVPDLSSRLADPKQVLIALAKRLPRDGPLVLRARSSAHQGLTQAAMAADPVVRPATQFYFFSPATLQRLVRDAGFVLSAPIEEADGSWLTVQARRGPPVLNVAVLAGIGDVLWSLVLAPALLTREKAEKLRLFIQDYDGETANRANALLERFERVAEVIPARFPAFSSPLFDPDTGHYNWLPAGPVPAAEQFAEAPFTYRFVINAFLERGLDFPAIASKLGLDPKLIDHDIFAGYQSRLEDSQGVEKILAGTKGNYIVFYLSSVVANTEAGYNRGGLWQPEDWHALGRRLRDALGCRIVITGAAYDLDYLRLFTRMGGDDFYDIYLNTVGQFDINETRAVLQEARFVVGYPSGIPIMATYLGTPTAIFWRPQHLPLVAGYDKAGFDPGFARCWVPPQVLADNRYLDLWFGVDTPETVAEKLLAAGW